MRTLYKNVILAVNHSGRVEHIKIKHIERKMIRLTIYIIVLSLTVSCSNNGKSAESYIPEAPDYSDARLWYTDDAAESTDVDIFYVTPTCIFDWKNEESGQISHHYDLYQEVMKENFDYSLGLAQDIFAEQCDFYSPYYRQISLESWLEEESVIEQRFSIAMNDIEEAFKYYMKHYNNGNDFILAGYSQGAKAVIELVKGLDESQLSKMVAAYAIGYRITDKDLENSNIKLAENENDIGVVVCYNSVKSIEDMWNVVSAGNKACINPLNWRTDSAKAMLGDSISVYVESENKVLIVSGYDGGGVHIPILNGVISDGNYHLSELTLFHEQLRDNVKSRILNSF